MNLTEVYGQLRVLFIRISPKVLRRAFEKEIPWHKHLQAHCKYRLNFSFTNI